ncbi:MAG: ATP-binding cassette domain-containing protein [Anaerolineae bacterium]
MIKIEGLHFSFAGSSRPALHDVDLHIAPGEFVVVSGPSGCGKSTLALAIGGYLFRQYEGQAGGRVTVAGMDVQEQPIYDVAEVVGLVQQNPEAQFCTLTVQDEVAFGLENRRLPPTEIRKRMAWALDIVGAGHLADRPLAALSGGEKQKVAVAAMMATKPKVLIFDEPTSNLDPTATADVFEVITHIRDKADVTVIVIEHKLDYLRPFAPRMVVMEAGGIVYDGPFEGAPRPPALGSRRPPPPGGTLPPGNDAAGAVVRVEDLYAGYDGETVLHGVSVAFQPGEFVALMGDNGSGKTTFLHSLLGLLKPQAGRLEVLGHDSRQMPVSRLARQVGLVFQNPDHQIFADSVWQEAVLAPRNFRLLDQATTQRVDEYLQRSGLGRRLSDHPYRLSYGEKRRLNLISILSYEPQLILLDEVLIGQDPANAAFLLDLVRERVEAGATALMVNHTPQVSRAYANRLLFFDRGRVLVDAPPEQAFGRLAELGHRAYVPPPVPMGGGAPVPAAAKVGRAAAAPAMLSGGRA